MNEQSRDTDFAKLERRLEHVLGQPELPASARERHLEGLGKGRSIRPWRGRIFRYAAAIVFLLTGAGLAVAILDSQFDTEIVISADKDEPGQELEDMFPVLAEPAGPEDHLPDDHWFYEDADHDDMSGSRGAFDTESIRFMARFDDVRFFIATTSNEHVCVVQIVDPDSRKIEGTNCSPGFTISSGYFFFSGRSLNSNTTFVTLLPKGYDEWVELSNGTRLEVINQVVYSEYAYKTGEYEATAHGPAGELDLREIPIGPAER